MEQKQIINVTQSKYVTKNLVQNESVTKKIGAHKSHDKN